MEETQHSISLRALNEYCYCRRLFYLMYVDKEFASNPDVEIGSADHAKAEMRQDNITTDEEVSPWDYPPSSLRFGDAGLMLYGELDAIKLRSGEWIPVEAKKSSAPDKTRPQYYNGFQLVNGAWNNDQLQVIGQMYLLRENGYECNKASIYYRGSKTHAEIVWSQELFAALKAMVDDILACESGERPKPLKHSIKCTRCSLNQICLPDEVNYLDDDSKNKKEPRAIIPARYEGGLVYVNGFDKKLAIHDGNLRVSSLSGEKEDILLEDVLSVVIMGTAQISTQCLQALMEKGIRILFCSQNGWMYGVASGFSDKNVKPRSAQLSRFPNLFLARSEISAKIMNQKTLLRRKREIVGSDVIDSMDLMAKAAEEARDFPELLGIEGNAAKLYFSKFNCLIGGSFEFDFSFRNRRPPKDPVNAMLSYSYALLVKDMTNAIIAVGLEPSLGFFHSFEKGRPSLALDIMESYRPIICDSAVLRTINTQMVSKKDFECTKAGVVLKPTGKKALILSYEARMNTMIQHPQFSYPMTYRRMLEVEVRLLLRFLEGEVRTWKPFRAR